MYRLRYTALMQGRAQAHCLTCLLEFGCLTAGHGCPDCSKPFDYRPAMFNRRFTCGEAIKARQPAKRGGKAASSRGCGKQFGIMQFLSSAAKAAETEAALKAAECIAEQRARAAESRNARAARATKARWENGDESSADDGGYDEELGAFIVSEDCPVCGKQFSTGHAKHLSSCRAAAVKTKGKASAKRKRPSLSGFIVGADAQVDSGYRPEKQAAAKRRKKSSQPLDSQATSKGATKANPKAKPKATKAKSKGSAAARKPQAKQKQRKPKAKPKAKEDEEESDEDFVVDDY